MKTLYKWTITTKPLRVKKEVIENVKEKRNGHITSKREYTTYGFKEDLGKYKAFNSYGNPSQTNYIQYISLKDNFDLEKVKEILLKEIDENMKELQIKEDKIKELKID
ncbi:beclin 1 [Clostridium sporogenes]|uniref:beclin 1 n=1 Tax=Clostridium sporogenes TaxID=1509 RepID=UPI002237846A|nr:beclin 1 [Clostridium sporogenes]MCW6079028.1 beclin 1 [Clostridium sporogenes]